MASQNLKLNLIEEDYQKIKSKFQREDNLKVAYKIAEEIKEHKETFKQVFKFLISAFKGKTRNDKKTPLVFHSIYLTRILYLAGERNLDDLLTASLHDVLEDTEISEDILINQKFMFGKENLIKNLIILKENVNLSRESNGKDLPPRYLEHIKRLLRAPKEVINTEIVDRFSDLMDLEYILELSKEDRELRLKSKIIKVKGFVKNITKGRNDFNKNCFYLFKTKVEQIENKFDITVETPIIS